MFWLAIFAIGGRTDSFYDLAKTLYEEAENLKILVGIAAALPIGVLIHQFSVLTKNWLIGSYFEEFSDFPSSNFLQDDSELGQYCRERVSNLNSFYYVRFDNGLLAPLFAWFVVDVLIGLRVESYLLIFAGVIALVTLAYIPRIRDEMKFYQRMAENSPDPSSNVVLTSQASGRV